MAFGEDKRDLRKAELRSSAAEILARTPTKRRAAPADPGPKRPRQAMSDEDSKTIRDMAGKGKTADQIGQAIGRTRGSVIGHVSRNGIKLQGSNVFLSGSLNPMNQRAPSSNPIQRGVDEDD